MAEPSTLVVDSSPLILLARAEVLYLLESAAERVLVPAAVAREVRAKPGDPAAEALDSLAWLEWVEASSTPAVIRQWGLGAGEEAVLACAAERPSSRAVLDDDRARRAAVEIDVEVVGSLGLVLAAKARGEMLRARPVIERLVDEGMYLSPRLLSRALALVGE